MKSEFTTFERRMQSLSVLMNQRLISCPELARRFRVSDDTITRDISVLSGFAPIGSKIQCQIKSVKKYMCSCRG